MAVLNIFRDRHWGFILCLVVLLNLAIGSLAMDAFPKLYPPFFPLDLTAFFTPVRIEHAWLYALLVTFSLFGLNLLWSLVETIIRMMRSGDMRMKSVAALLIHAALALILLSHVVDGFWGRSDRMMLGPEPVPLPGLGMVRLEGLQDYHHPDGSLKDTDARLVFKQSDGSELRKTIAYNEPAIFAGGQRQVIIQGGGMQPVGLKVIRESDGAEVDIPAFEPQTLPGGHLVLQGVFETESGLPVAQFAWTPEGGAEGPLFMVLDQRGAQHTQIAAGGDVYRFKGFMEVPTVSVIVRQNPAIPMVIVALTFSALGTILLGLWIRRDRGARS